MSGAQQKNWGPAAGVLLLTILLGPPIGGVVFFCGLVLNALFNGDGFPLGDMLGGVFGAAALSYLPGGVQAIVMGVLSAAVVLLRGSYGWLVAAGLAVASNTLVLLLFIGEPPTDSFRATLEMFAVFTGLSVVAAMVLWAMFRKLGLIRPRAMAG